LDILFDMILYARKIHACPFDAAHLSRYLSEWTKLRAHEYISGNHCRRCAIFRFCVFRNNIAWIF